MLVTPNIMNFPLSPAEHLGRCKEDMKILIKKWSTTSHYQASGITLSSPTVQTEKLARDLRDSNLFYAYELRSKTWPFLSKQTHRHAEWVEMKLSLLEGGASLTWGREVRCLRLWLFSLSSHLLLLIIWILCSLSRGACQVGQYERSVKSIDVSHLKHLHNFKAISDS